MKQSILSTLMRCEVFSGLDGKIPGQTIDSVPYKLKSYRRRVIIHFQDDVYRSLVILLGGKVDAARQDYDGRTLKIETMEGPDALAPGVLFTVGASLPMMLTAASDAGTLLLPRSSIAKMGRRYPDILLSLMKDSGNRIEHLVEKLRLARFRTLRRKVAGYLIGCAQKQRMETVVLENSKEELAELFGAARLSVSRAFAELETAGLIDQDGKTV